MAIFQETARCILFDTTQRMNIHQLSLLHDPIQDRILLRISTTEREEIRLWLTRRLTLGLQPYLKRASVDPAATPESRAEAMAALPPAQSASAAGRVAFTLHDQVVVPDFFGQSQRLLCHCIPQIR